MEILSIAKSLRASHFHMSSIGRHLTNILDDLDSKQDPTQSNASSFSIHYKGTSLTMIELVGHMEEHQCKVYSYSMQFLLQNKCMTCCPDGKSRTVLLNSANMRHVNMRLTWLQEGWHIQQMHADQGV